MKCSIKRPHVRCVLALLALTVSVLIVRGGGFCVASAGDESSLPRLAEADAALRRAFAAVSDAEAAGVNVSGLLAELDVAGRNLTEAELAYSRGDVAGAVDGADRCVAGADVVADEAVSLMGQALVDGRTALWRAVTFSGVGVFVFLVVLVLVWVLFRRSYSVRLLRARPEVAMQ